jgi:hypothetical protein
MHVVSTGGDALVYSPTWLDEATCDAVQELGRPRLLIAPNHFHHLALSRYRERFQGAEAAASRGATPRLESKGHTALRPLEELDLPPGVRLLVPDGTKSGEAWLSVDTEGDGEAPTWLVCDAFFHETAPVRGLEGMFLRAGKITPGLAIGATFTRLCLRDREAYVAWVHDALLREKPRRVLFSHGDALEGDVVGELGRILDARLPRKLPPREKHP